MTNKEFEKKMNSIQEKLGKENSSLIADEIGLLITDNANVNSQLADKDKQIEKLTQDKENLISVNGNLLQQVAMADDTVNIPKVEEKKKEFDFRSVFDEKGNFIK